MKLPRPLLLPGGTYSAVLVGLLAGRRIYYRYGRCADSLEVAAQCDVLLVARSEFVDKVSLAHRTPYCSGAGLGRLNHPSVQEDPGGGDDPYQLHLSNSEREDFSLAMTAAWP